MKHDLTKHCSIFFDGVGVWLQVEVNILTGETRVLATDILYDGGKTLNAAIDVGQVNLSPATICSHDPSHLSSLILFAWYR